MDDFYEIDFLDVESKKSGDAIALRYRINGMTYIHVIDGGYQDTGDKLISHIDTYYDSPDYINHVVVTHNDGDHTGGLSKVLESYDIGELWMLRPWSYANELLPRFARFTTVSGLESRLREIYSNIAALEDIAIKRKIKISEPFQGAMIGKFRVMTPSKKRYLDLIVASEKTPEASKASSIADIGLWEGAKAKVSNLVKSLWGQEVFSNQETSAENEMSVVQFSELAGHKILLTGDVGRAGLNEAADYAPFIGLNLPGIYRFQVPHHGSRRNVSVETLDRWLGPKLSKRPVEGQETFTAIISSAKADADHPRNSVVRAMHHRGAKVITTEGASIKVSRNGPKRDGWGPIEPLEYPEYQESL